MNEQKEIYALLKTLAERLDLDVPEPEPRKKSLGLVIGFCAPHSEPKEIMIDSWEEFEDLHSALHAIERYRM